MKKLVIILAITVGMVVVSGVSANSFSAYFGNGAWGFSMNFGYYDYYNRYSPGFYDSGSMDFYTALSPYGVWRYIAEYDQTVWIPFVPFGWRPYSYGAWSYTHYGWTWTAYEPWGWIPHHYGNWLFHSGYGWLWVPGYTWAPAHVTWGFFNGYYGWAPMPPRHSNYYRSQRQDNRYRRSRSHHWYSRSSYRGGYSTTGDHQDNEPYEWIPNEAWVIVPGTQFMHDNISEVAIKSDDNMQIFSNRSFKMKSDPPVKSVIEQDTRRSVSVTQIDEVTKIIDGNKVKVVRPQKMDADRSRKIGTVYQNFSPDTIRNARSAQEAPVSGQPKPAVQAPSAPKDDSLQKRPEQQRQPLPSSPSRITPPTPVRSNIKQPATRSPAPQSQQRIQPPQPKATPSRQKAPEQKLKPPTKPTPSKTTPPQQIPPTKQIKPPGKQPNSTVNQPSAPQKQPKQKTKKEAKPAKDEAKDSEVQEKKQGALGKN